MRDGKLEFYTLIDFHKEKDAMKRIQKMWIEICKVLDEYDLDAIYMEKSIDKKNIDTLQKLSYLAGGIMFYCVQKNIKFVNPFPSEWRARIGIKQSSKIKREMLKAEAIIAVKKEYDIDVGDDVAEAILICRSAFDLPIIELTEDELVDASL
jgi:Holliday junction resolvasome RuvABC endonuclease subunit